MLQEQKITSFSPSACIYRNQMRSFVDNLFAKRSTMIKSLDGSRRLPSRKEKAKFDFEARQLWRSIIVDSNKL